MKTLIVLSAAMLLSFVSPAYASHGPTPVSKKDQREMLTKKKKKNKKNGHKKDRKLFGRDKKSCAGMVN